MRAEGRRGGPVRQAAHARRLDAIWHAAFVGAVQAVAIAKSAEDTRGRSSKAMPPSRNASGRRVTML